MAEPRESISSKIIVGVVVGVFIAVVGGASAPWWLKAAFPEVTNVPASATPPKATAPGPVVLPSSNAPRSSQTPGVETVTGCVLTITNPLVSLHERPDIRSVETGSVPTGTYVTLDTAVASFAGREQRWFQIDASDRIGWILYDTILVESKSAQCP